MRYRHCFGFPAAFLACACFVSTYALAQDKHDHGHDHKDKSTASGAAPAGMDEAAMKAMMEAGAPGPHHKGLEPMAGKFKYTNKFRMDPSQEWITSEGEYNGEMIMDGRYLTFTVSGPMMGSQFLGMGCIGYDNVLKKHVSGWIDNMGTGLMRSEGTCDGTCKTITFEGEMVDPMTKKPTKYKYVYEMKGPDEYSMRWWSPSMTDGKMFESMSISYTRVK